MTRSVVDQALDFRFEQIAETLRQQIATGILKVGERLPSVRMLSRQQGVSLSTAFRAYYELENQGFVVARPKSGYYVRTGSIRSMNSPQPTRPQPNATPVTVSQALRQLAKGWMNANIVDLSVAVPALSLLPQAKLNKTLLHAVRALPDSGLGYQYTGGLPDLQRQVARLLTNGGSQVSPSGVVVTNGCIEALGLALRAVTKPGDVVAIESPAYYGVLQVLERLGLQAFELPTDPQTGPDLTVLDHALTAKTVQAVLLTPSFSNPSGYCLSDERKIELVTLLVRHDIPLIEDDIYGELYFGRTRPHTVHGFDTTGRVLLCGSVSKTLAPGYRVGWLLPGRYQEAVEQARLLETASPAVITQATVATFIQQGHYERHLRGLRSTLQRQILAYSEVISQTFPPGTSISQPDGGLVLWIELPEAVSARTLLERAIGQGITFFPGYLFTTQLQYGNCLRISCGQPLSNQYEEGIRQLGKLAGALATHQG